MDSVARAVGAILQIHSLEMINSGEINLSRTWVQLQLEITKRYIANFSLELKVD